MHITISGKLGSGKSTVCKILCSKYGFERYSTGDIQRSIAEKKGLTTLQMNELMWQDKSFDKMIDDAVAEISESCADKRIVFDSRMAWHFAKNAFRTFVYVDPYESGKRVLGDDRGSVEKYSSVEEAKNMLIERSINENSRFKEIYNVDNFEYDNYDLVIDSTSISPEEVLDILYTEYTAFCNNRFDCTKVFLCPTSIYPAVCADEKETGDRPVITRVGHYNVLVGNVGAYVDAVRSGKSTVECEYVEPKPGYLDEKLPLDLIKNFETETGISFKYYPEIYI